MDIIFKTNKLKKVFGDEKLMVTKLGVHRSKLLKRRLTQLAAADTLEDLCNLPQVRCHELVGSRKGCLSVDPDHPYRLIFEPAHNPLPKKPDGGLNWANVTEVRIIKVEDTHG